MDDELPAKRKYQLKKRADEMAETRRRITEAAVELHGTVGPARTTLSEVARRAGVQRHTVYRHFPTDAELLGACSAHYFTANPWPDLDGLARDRRPQQRLACALDELYAYYERTEPMYRNVLRDAEVVDGVREALVPMQAFLDAGRRGARGRLAARAAGDGASSTPRCAMPSTSSPGARSRRTAASPGRTRSSSSARSSKRAASPSALPRGRAARCNVSPPRRSDRTMARSRGARLPGTRRGRDRLPRRSARPPEPPALRGAPRRVRRLRGLPRADPDDDRASAAGCARTRSRPSCASRWLDSSAAGRG